MPTQILPNAHESDKEILELIEQPTTSYWLKEALSKALGRDCLQAADEAQLMAQLLERRRRRIMGA